MYYPPGYHPALARTLADLVVQAYRQYDSASSEEPWTLEGYELIREFRVAPDTETKGSDLSHWIGRLTGKKQETPAPLGFVARKGNEVFVVFRGTKTPGEWVSNAKATLAPFPESEGQVHGGFLAVFQSLRDTLGEALRESGGRDLYITGHSLGAALATLLAASLKEPRHRLRGVYLFGSPRVGDDAFVQAYNRRYARLTYRISNTSDVVTSVPLPVPMVGSWGGYFSHVDTPVDFTRQDDDVLKNHRMATYRDEVWKASPSLWSRWFG